MGRAIGHEIEILLSELEQQDILKVLARAQELATQGRFRGKIQIVSALQDRIILISNSDIFEHDNQEKNQLEKTHERAARFLKELGVFKLGGKVATSRNLWELLWRPQIDHLMNNLVANDVVDNHVAALTLMIPCIDRTFTLIYPQNGDGYTTAMMKWAFPEKEVSISAKDYKTCIRTMRDGLVNGLKHDAFLRPNVYLHGAENNPLPFYVQGDYVIVNPQAFWTHVRNKIDNYYADKPRNITIGP